MSFLLLFIVEVCAFVLVHSLPPSPCPNVFQYELRDLDANWNNELPFKGVISVVAFLPSFLKVQLMIPIALTTKYAGRLELADKNFWRKFKPGSPTTIKYNLFYPADVPVPQIELIQINNEVVCSSKPAPSRVKTTVILDHSLKPFSRNFFTDLSSSADQFPIPNFFPIFPNFNDYREMEIETYDPKPVRPVQSISPGIHNSESTTHRNPHVSCGVSTSINPLIVGGSSYKRGECPWAVPLFKKDELGLRFICGASLISDQLVLTAAHCVKLNSSTVIDRSELIAYVGMFNLKNWAEDNHQPRDISEIIIHPDYNPDNYYSDLAVLRLERFVTFSQYVTPACLWSGEENLNDIVGKNGVVVGWGMDENGNKVTDTPKFSRLPIVSQEECVHSNYQLVPITSNKTLCAGFKNGTGPCNGDSGGGLMLPITEQDGSTRWYLRGLVSVSISDPNVGNRCNLYEYVVFTDLAKHKKWLSTFISINF